MFKGYDIRPWRPGDESAILELFQDSFGKKLSIEYWNWRFRDHPAGPPLIMLAWRDGKLAAHYGASQAPIWSEGSIVPAALSVSTMTHPNDRGLGLLEAVGEALYDKLFSEGYSAVWGFPNAMINATRRRKLNWVAVDDVATFSLAVECKGPRQSEIGINVETVDAIDARIGNFQKELGGTVKNTGIRNKATLKWRIDDNPLNSYRRYIIRDGSRIAGYAITKAFGSKTVDIVDLTAVDDGHTTALLDAVLEHARAEKVNKLNCWCLRMDPARIAVERFGFAATAPVTYFAGRCFDSSIVDFSDSRRWRISMLDSDLY